MSMEKHLIVVDLDGTLMLDFKKYERKAVRLLKKLNKKHIVMIATGRPIRSSYFMYKKMHLNSPLINYNGALITHPLDPNFPRTDLRIHKEDLFDILDKFKNGLVNVFSEIVDDIYVLNYNKFTKPYMHTKGGKLHIGSLEYNLPDNPNGSIIFVKKGISKEIEEYIKEKYSNRLRFRYWGEDKGFEIGEIYNINTNKGRGVIDAIKYYNIDPKYVIAIGDGHNDIEMFEASSIKVAVGNAHNDLMPYANVHADSCTNKGVYKFLKNYFKEN